MKRLFSRRESIPIDTQLRRLEERRRTIQKAADQWLSLLREMEQLGQSTHVDYERYYQAYADAKKQLKECELNLFNLRNQKPG